MCVQIDFQAFGIFHANRAPILHLALSPNRPNRASTWAPSPKTTNKCVQNGFLDYGALGAHCAPILHRN